MTVAFVKNERPFSSAVCAGAMAKADDLGMTRAGDFTYDTTDDDSTIATKAGEIAATDAEVVVNCGHEADTVRMVLALNALDTPFCPKAMLATNSLINLADHYKGDTANLPQ